MQMHLSEGYKQMYNDLNEVILGISNITILLFFYDYTFYIYLYITIIFITNTFFLKMFIYIF